MTDLRVPGRANERATITDKGASLRKGVFVMRNGRGGGGQNFAVMNFARTFCSACVHAYRTFVGMGILVDK